MKIININIYIVLKLSKYYIICGYITITLLNLFTFFLTNIISVNCMGTFKTFISGNKLERKYYFSSNCIVKSTKCTSKNFKEP